MGRPGLDPSTLGVGPSTPPSSVIVQITWSMASSSPPTSAEILANLMPWLHNWLQNSGNDASAALKICGVDGLEIELHVGSSAD